MNGRLRYFCGVQGFSLLLLAGTSLSSAGQIDSGNLVVNGGFETGNLTGWSVSDATGISVNSNSLHYGVFGLEAGSAASTRHVTQTIVDSGFKSLNHFSFFVKLNGENSASFSASINGQIVQDSYLPEPSGWTQMHYDLDVPGNGAPGGYSYLIDFSFTNSSSSIFLDDVTLFYTWTDCFDGLGHACPCPEPSSFALLGLGGIGVALRAYRKRTPR